jgi:hypothetical protein
MAVDVNRVGKISLLSFVLLLRIRDAASSPISLVSHHSSYPQGCTSVWVTVIAILTYVFAMTVAFGCAFVAIDLEDSGSPIRDGDNNVLVGFFSLEAGSQSNDSDACIGWSNEAKDFFFDGAWRAAGAFAVITSVIVFIIIIVSFCLACVAVDRSCLRFIFCLLVFSVLCEILTIALAFASDLCDRFDCKLEAGAGLAIAASVLLFLNGVLFLCTKPATNNRELPTVVLPAVVATPVEPVQEAPGVTKILERVTVFPDGTKKTVTTTYGPDGSEIIQENETIERPDTEQEFCVVPTAPTSTSKISLSRHLLPENEKSCHTPR